MRLIAASANIMRLGPAPKSGERATTGYLLGMSESLRAQPLRPSAAVCRAIEIIEAESAYSQHVCAPPHEAARLGLAAERMGSAAVILTRKSKNTMYNKLAALGQASPATERQVDRFIDMARQHRVKKISVPLGDGMRPRGLPRLLESRGFVRGYPNAKLWRDGSPLPPPRIDPERRPNETTHISVRRVRPSEASAWVDVVSEVWRVFGFRRAWYEARVAAPGWRHYLAWIDDEPVAAGALFIGTVGAGNRAVKVGHLVDAITLKPWRRRGAQAAIIRRRVADGRGRGCELFTSETAPPLPRSASTTRVVRTSARRWQPPSLIQRDRR